MTFTQTQKHAVRKKKHFFLTYAASGSPIKVMHNNTKITWNTFLPFKRRTLLSNLGFAHRINQGGQKTTIFCLLFTNFFFHNNEAGVDWHTMLAVFHYDKLGCQEKNPLKTYSENNWQVWQADWPRAQAKIQSSKIKSLMNQGRLTKLKWLWYKGI